MVWSQKKVKMVDGSLQDYKACETLRIMIQGIYDRCGFKGASSHTGRKSFATNAAIRGVDIDRIAEAMGHDDSDMTLKYIQIDQDRIKRMYEDAI
ncbi:tyrosine-type recombinase/integrase [Aliikangiella marina]|uniref:Tyrosine-type recombinase/integrase n=1 Tax=Aliikangiella marina TaxID=1712262 RepID=A0A545T328_9GAMM|nr:tyrosine-type recombinase/integrase [Aliikangiella marina]TQV71616.1 tyrosine-type recombinase/integrase [Aliikangiella marina]